MYELFLVACVGVKLCQYVMVPYSYPTESRCRIAAAMLAGQVRGSRESGLDLTYRHDCNRKFPVAELAIKRRPAQTGVR
jgi:hypothetical protein